MTAEREIALEKAVEFVTSGRMITDIGISTVIEAAEKFHTFLTADSGTPSEPTPGSGTPSDTSTAPASTPAPSKVPAQPDEVEF